MQYIILWLGSIKRQTGKVCMEEYIRKIKYWITDYENWWALKIGHILLMPAQLDNNILKYEILYENGKLISV